MAVCNGLAIMDGLSVKDDQDSGTVELGFVEEIEKNQLYRIRHHHYFFQGKVGGKPAWLSFKPLPSPSELQCGVCGEQLIFLLQIYAPIDDRPDCFHRTLFLFLCRNPSCSVEDSAKNLAVFRCQLPRKNDFYSFSQDKALDPDVDKNLPENTITADSVTNLCFVCGAAGPKRCSRCQNVTYCSKQHQALHWKRGHKTECNGGHKMDLSPSSEDDFDGILFPEYELVTEPEVIEEERKKERPETERLKDYREYLEQMKAERDDGVGQKQCSPDDLESMVKKPDKEFKAFQRRILQNPEQVIRYQLGGQTLWATSLSGVSREVPACEQCGSKRQMEFQLMPHLLTHLGVDSVGRSIDWATVVVFTCAKHCAPDLQGAYIRESVVKQDFLQDDVM